MIWLDLAKDQKICFVWERAWRFFHEWDVWMVRSSSEQGTCLWRGLKWLKWHWELGWFGNGRCVVLSDSSLSRGGSENLKRKELQDHVEPHFFLFWVAQAFLILSGWWELHDHRFIWKYRLVWNNLLLFKQCPYPIPLCTSPSIALYSPCDPQFFADTLLSLPHFPFPSHTDHELPSPRCFSVQASTFWYTLHPCQTSRFAKAD